MAIKSTTSVKYLGATLDQTLSFSEMAQSLLKKALAKVKVSVQEKAVPYSTHYNTFSNVFNSMTLWLCLSIVFGTKV